MSGIRLSGPLVRDLDCGCRIDRPNQSHDWRVTWKEDGCAEHTLGQRFPRNPAIGGQPKGRC